MATLGTDKNLHILLVGAEQQRSADLTQALTGRIERFQIDWVAQPELSPVRARDLSPDLILLDATFGESAFGKPTFGDADLSWLVQELHTQAAGAVILALVNSNDMEQARRAVLAGARGFLNKPLVADDVMATLNQVLLLQPNLGATHLRSSATGGRVIAFCAPKSGVGCTTLLVNSAIALQRLSKKLLTLVDANFTSPALPILLNLYDVFNISDLLDHLPRLDHDLLDEVLATHAVGPRLLLAPQPSETSRYPTVEQMQQILVHLKRNADWVAVDLGQPSTPVAFTVLDAADRIVMVVQPEMTSLQQARNLLDRLLARGYPESKIWLVLNRSTMGAALSKAEFERRLRLRVQQTIPDDQPLVTHSTNRGVPLVMSHASSALAKACVGLAQQFAHDPSLVIQPQAMQVLPRVNPLQRWLRTTRTAHV